MIYDCVYSLGQWCATAIYLKRLGLRAFSGPFDWVGPTTELPVYFETICGDFRAFMLKENLRFLESDPIEGTDHYEDVTTGWHTHHEFRTGIDFETNYRNYHAMLSRRVKRFQNSLMNGQRVLLVHFHGGGERYAASAVCAGMQRLREKYPSARVDLLLLEPENHHAGLTRESLTEGVVRVTGDFYDRARFDPVMGNDRLVRSVLGGIRLHGKFRNLLRQRMQSFKRRFMRIFKRGKASCD